jgi:hypothetical protein
MDEAFSLATATGNWDRFFATLEAKTAEAQEHLHGLIDAANLVD